MTWGTNRPVAHRFAEDRVLLTALGMEALSVVALPHALVRGSSVQGTKERRAAARRGKGRVGRTARVAALGINHIHVASQLVHMAEDGNSRIGVAEDGKRAATLTPAAGFGIVLATHLVPRTILCIATGRVWKNRKTGARVITQPRDLDGALRTVFRTQGRDLIPWPSEYRFPRAPPRKQATSIAEGSTTRFTVRYARNFAAVSTNRRILRARWVMTHLDPFIPG